MEEIELKYNQKIESTYDRTVDASLKFTKCHLTGEETWCVSVDISIRYINENLNNFLNSNNKHDNRQEIENKLIEFIHKKEQKDYPIHDLSIFTAMDFIMELIKDYKN